MIKDSRNASRWPSESSKAASENTLRELVENITCDLPDGFTYLDDKHTKVVDAIMQAFTAAVETVKNELESRANFAAYGIKIDQPGHRPTSSSRDTQRYIDGLWFAVERLAEMVGKK